jgi:hypothetical protein
MKDDSDAWRQLEQRAADQLGADFASRVMRVSRGPSEAAWLELHEVGADQLRLGFADRVLRAVRAGVSRPSFRGQLALGGATLACLIVAVVYFHERSTRSQDERSLASWEELANESQYFGLRQ